MYDVLTNPFYDNLKYESVGDTTSQLVEKSAADITISVVIDAGALFTGIDGKVRLSTSSVLA